MIPDPALVLHLNGPPGVGKSTLARLWADAHPGTLVVEADALRTWVSGWRDDFVETGARIRPVALSMISAYAGEGLDVVVPQLIADSSELARFEHAATSVGARFVEVFLETTSGEIEERFRARTLDTPWLDAVHLLVDEAPPDHLERYRLRLADLADSRPDAVRLMSRTGDVSAAYDDLVSAVSAVSQ